MNEDGSRGPDAATRAQQPDPEAARTTQLGRSGDQRSRYFELCRLARLGDRRARDETVWWSPWPQEGGVRRRFQARVAPIRRTPQVVVWEVEAPGERIAAVSSTTLFLVSRTRLSALSLDGFSVQWTRQITPNAVVALVGEDVLCCERGDVVSLDGRTGNELRRTQVEGAVVYALVERDRAVLLLLPELPSLPGGTVTCLDVGAGFGARLWSTPYSPDLPPNQGFGWPPTRLVLAGDVLLHATAPSVVELRNLNSGQLVSRRTLGAGPNEDLIVLHTADDRGVVCRTGLFLEERAPDFEECRWRSDLPTFGFPAVGSESLVMVTPRIDGLSLRGHSRTSGAALWGMEPRATGADEVTPRHAYALADAVFYFALASRDSVVVGGLDSTTGESVFDASISVRPDAYPLGDLDRGPTSVIVLDLAPLPDGLVVLTSSAGKTVLAELRQF